MASRTRNSTLNLITGFSGQFLLIVLKFTTRTVFIHTLGKSYLGITGLFSDILVMLSLTELGFDTAINYKLYSPLEKRDWQRIRVLMKFYRQVYTLVGITVIALGMCLIPVLPYLIKDYSRLSELGVSAELVFILYLLNSATSYLFFAYRSAVTEADQKTYILTVADYFISIASSIVQILVLVFLKNFILHTATLIVFSIFRNLVNALISSRRYPQAFEKTDKKLDVSEVRDMFKDCGALFVYRLNDIVLKATDNLVLSTFLGLSIVGMYSNYLMFYHTFSQMLSRLYTSVKASAGNLFVVADNETKYRFFKTMVFITMLIYGTAAIGITVVADEIILCWIGPDYLVPQPLSLLVGIEILFLGLRDNLSQIRNVTGLFRQMWFRPVIGAALNIILSVALVKPFGIYGVITATLISMLLTDLLIDPVIIMKHAFNNQFPVSAYFRSNLLYMLVFSVTCAADYFLCRIILPDHGWLSVIVHIFICGISLPLMLCIFYHRTEEFRYLKQIIGRILGKIRRKGAV